MALRKIYSAGGPATSLYPEHPNDYRHHGNRLFLNQSNTRWVKFWVSWYDLHEHQPPTGLGNSWHIMNTVPNAAGYPIIRELDDQIRAANDDGRGVILTINHTYPTWASWHQPSEGAPRSDPTNAARLGYQKVPLSCAVNSPFGWFIQYLCARYIRGENSPGPGAPGGGFGNPSQARIDVLEVVNEPNLLLWNHVPQSEYEGSQDGLPHKVAQMLETADSYSLWAADGTNPSLPIAGPATSDHPDAMPPSHRQSIPWESFTRSVLTLLANWRPRVYAVWSHHNYRDIKYGPNYTVKGAGQQVYRAKAVIDMLYGYNWRGGGNRHLWITEGGLDLGAGDLEGSDSGGKYPRYSSGKQSDQVTKIQQCFAGYQSVPDITSFSQHTISDHHPQGHRVDTQNYGFRDEFNKGSWTPRSVRLAWDMWLSLGPWAP